MVELLRGTLLRVLLAQALSSMGSSITAVALAVMVFELTGSVLHMGAVLAASTLPLVVMSFVGGALLDRFEARRLMVIADLARAVLIVLMPLAARQSVGLIYVIAASVGTMSAVFNPSQVKLVGDLVETSKLVKANSYLSLARDGAELGGVPGWRGTGRFDWLHVNLRRGRCYICDVSHPAPWIEVVGDRSEVRHSPSLYDCPSAQSGHGHLEAYSAEDQPHVRIVADGLSINEHS